jgi:hypothetical protein
VHQKIGSERLTIVAAVGQLVVGVVATVQVSLLPVRFVHPIFVVVWVVVPTLQRLETLVGQTAVLMATGFVLVGRIEVAWSLAELVGPTVLAN